MKLPLPARVLERHGYSADDATIGQYGEWGRGWADDIPREGDAVQGVAARWRRGRQRFGHGCWRPECGSTSDAQRATGEGHLPAGVKRPSSRPDIEGVADDRALNGEREGYRY
jgi:hypothetical protein